MNLLWIIVRRTFSDIWHEAFLLILFNFIWVLGSGPGLLFIAYGASSRSLLMMFIGLIVIVPLPFLTFSLFHATFEVVEQKAIGLRRFFQLGRQTWRQAYRWGLLNLLILPILVSSISFYSNPDSPLGGTRVGTVVSSLFMSITLFWLLLQLFVLTIYPRLEVPRIRNTLEFAAKLILRWPVPTLFVAFVGMGFGLASFFVPILPILITFSLIAILANRTTSEILSEEAKRDSAAEI